MSNAIYPTLAGVMFDSTRTPVFKTDIKTTPSGREFRGAQMTYPLYKYSLTYEFLRDMAAFNEFRTLISFYTARQGCFDSFLYQDPDDNAVTAQAFGIGDNVTTTFQLVRTLGATVEPVYDLNGSPQIYINGALQTLGTNYSINSTGGVTLTAPAGGGAVLSWTGSYYWRVRFLTDEQTFSKMFQSMWETKQVQFITVKP